MVRKISLATGWSAVDCPKTLEYITHVGNRGEEVTKMNAHLEEQNKRHGFDEETVASLL